jgi:hypothetical protein
MRPEFYFKEREIVETIFAFSDMEKQQMYGALLYVFKDAASKIKNTKENAAEIKVNARIGGKYFRIEITVKFTSQRKGIFFEKLQECTLDEYLDYMNFDKKEEKNEVH